jgi:hypothetical protein
MQTGYKPTAKQGAAPPTKTNIFKIATYGTKEKSTKP